LVPGFPNQGTDFSIFYLHGRFQDEDEEERYNRLIHKSKVTVMIPVDRSQLCLINRMVEFVIREGPIFEAMIMNREMNNRNFR
jgi:U2-associated protein SR140